MGRQVSSYHFINIDKYRFSDSLEYIKTLNELGTYICFDLEDGIKCNYLSSHKENIIAVLKLLNKEASKINLGIRINNPESKNFDDDLEFLQSFNKYFNIEVIFIPKVNNLRDIKFAIGNLKKRDINYCQVIPIIETKDGMNNVSEIGKASNILFNKLAFGHADYNYDMGKFPFSHQNSSTYWNWITCILSSIEPGGKSIINSPVLYLNNDKLFVQMLNKLNSICKNSFGQITLTINQTKLCGAFTNSHNCSSTIFNFENNKKPEYIIENYKKYKLNNQLIAIEPGEGYLISPQEFNAAKKYFKLNAKS